MAPRAGSLDSSQRKGNPITNTGTRVAVWEIVLVAAAAAIALGLGFPNLGAPSLWHDEAVQVLVAKQIAETGQAVLPSGNPHPVALVFNGLVALFIQLFGDSEAVVRTPSVLLSACNVLLTFAVFRPLLGRAPALIAAFALALSPWSVAWSRQARFYTAQQTCYLLMLWAGWRLLTQPDTHVPLSDAIRARSRNRLQSICYLLLMIGAYLLGIGTSLHSLLFLTPVGAYAFCMFLYARESRVRWFSIACTTAAGGIATILLYAKYLPSHDAHVVFNSATPLAVIGDPEQTWVFYYVSWLRGNLGLGFLLLAALGFLIMPFREGRRGLFAALAFWGPILVLSLVIGYRRHRFMYFAFPAYTAAFSYAIVRLSAWCAQTRRSWAHALLALLIIAFGVRLGVSAVRLIGTSIEAARGADTTLATRHPQYRKPCLYARDHLEPDRVVVADTYVTALYYVGRVNAWYPSKYLPWEAWEAGSNGIEDLDGLKRYVAQHPKGYFIAEWYRFQLFDFMQADREWVNAHMTRINGACSGDVTLYAWDRAAGL